MRLFNDVRAPSPRRVRIFLAEKGIEVPLEDVELRKGAHFDPAYLARNPDACVPCLELDDGRSIIESVSICRYFEALYPTPALFGADPWEIATVDSWLRRVESRAYIPVQDHYRNSRPGFDGRALPGTRGEVPRIQALVQRSIAGYARFLLKLETQLQREPFVAGSFHSMADIMLLTTLDFAEATKMPEAKPFDRHPALARWYGDVSRRPSASA